MIRIDTVRKAYGRTLALRDFSLSLSAGGLGVLRGPNGSGKSTALKITTGIALPDQGVRHVAADVIGYAGHRDQFPASVNIFRTLQSQVRLFTSNLDAMHDVAVRFGVDAYWHKTPTQLSQGMRQRAKLVRAFAVGPELLVLDEPQVGLDNTGLQTLFELLQQYMTNGGTTLLATHLDLPDLGVEAQIQWLATVETHRSVGGAHA